MTTHLHLVERLRIMTPFMPCKGTTLQCDSAGNGPSCIRIAVLLCELGKTGQPSKCNDILEFYILTSTRNLMTLKNDSVRLLQTCLPEHNLRACVSDILNVDIQDKVIKN